MRTYLTIVLSLTQHMQHQLQEVVNRFEHPSLSFTEEKQVYFSSSFYYPLQSLKCSYSNTIIKFESRIYQPSQGQVRVRLQHQDYVLVMVFALLPTQACRHTCLHHTHTCKYTYAHKCIYTPIHSYTNSCIHRPYNSTNFMHKCMCTHLHVHSLSCTTHCPQRPRRSI